MDGVFWDVFVGNKCIDSVQYDRDCDAEYVRTALIEHDGYSPRIQVRRTGKARGSRSEP